jgi:EpsI family protein
MNAALRRSLGIVSVMLTAAVAGAVLRPKGHIIEASAGLDLARDIPRNFGDWREEVEPYIQVVDPADAQLRERLYSQTLDRTYVDGKGHRIMLSISYGADQSEELQVHMPEICYPAQGFAVDDLALGTLDTRFRSLPVKRLVGTRAQRVEAVTYWIMIGDTPVANATARRLAKMRFGLNGAVPDGLVFRVSSVSDDRERAYGEQASLVRDLLDAVNDKTRNKLIGSID